MTFGLLFCLCAVIYKVQLLICILLLSSTCSNKTVHVFCSYMLLKKCPPNAPTYLTLHAISSRRRHQRLSCFARWYQAEGDTNSVSETTRWQIGQQGGQDGPVTVGWAGKFECSADVPYINRSARHSAGEVVLNISSPSLCREGHTWRHGPAQ